MPQKKTYFHKNMAKAQASRHLAVNEDSDTLATENDTPEPEDILVTADEILEPGEKENSWDGESMFLILRMILLLWVL